jgi:hypothetical protein
LICIQNPSVEAGATMKNFQDESKLLRKGKIPRNIRDVEWNEEDSDFPAKYGIDKYKPW